MPYLDLGSDSDSRFDHIFGFVDLASDLGLDLFFHLYKSQI
jgi:hypothetical protein